MPGVVVLPRGGVGSGKADALVEQAAEGITFDVPASLAASYRGRPMVVRAERASALVETLSERDLEDVSYLRLTSLRSEADPLSNWAHGVSVVLEMREPAAEFPRLYEYAPLTGAHPVGVAVAALPGFSRAVRVALSLEFAVKLEVEQPDRAMTEEMLDTLDLYLHRSTVHQPVEYFHSALLAWYHGDADTLWAIQEEDPAGFRYVTDGGEVKAPRRFAEVSAHFGNVATVEELRTALSAGAGECRECEFLDLCCGYFKSPRPDYGCDMPKAVFTALREAAAELRQDLAAVGGGEERQ